MGSSFFGKQMSTPARGVLYFCMLVLFSGMGGCAVFFGPSAESFDRWQLNLSCVQYGKLLKAANAAAMSETYSIALSTPKQAHQFLLVTQWQGGGLSLVVLNSLGAKVYSAEVAVDNQLVKQSVMPLFGDIHFLSLAQAVLTSYNEADVPACYVREKQNWLMSENEGGSDSERAIKITDLGYNIRVKRL